MTKDQALKLLTRHYDNQYGAVAGQLQNVDDWIIASILEAATVAENTHKMPLIEKLILTVVALVVVALTLLAFRNVEKLDAQRADSLQPAVVYLEDGTPCALNKNGGIACNWKGNK